MSPYLLTIAARPAPIQTTIEAANDLAAAQGARSLLAASCLEATDLAKLTSSLTKADGSNVWPPMPVATILAMGLTTLLSTLHGSRHGH